MKTKNEWTGATIVLALVGQGAAIVWAVSGMVKDIEAGIVWVNSYEDGDMTQPFGGYKQSGQARDKCLESLKSYTQSKSAWFRLAPE